MSKSRASKTKGAGLMIGHAREYQPFRLKNKSAIDKKPNRMIRRMAK